MYPTQLNKDLCPNFFHSIDGVLMDCDGVIWHGNTAIPGATEVVKKLKANGKKTIYVTNNSTKSQDELLKKFQMLGFPATKDEIYGTAHIAASYLKNLNFNSKVYTIGSSGISQELNNVGIENFGIGPDPIPIDNELFDSVKLEKEVGAVVVGFDAHLSYLKILKAASYLKSPQCLFIATNTDEQFPSPNKDLVLPGEVYQSFYTIKSCMLGSGVMVKSVEVASGRNATIMGKPSLKMWDLIRKDHNLSPDRTLMIGDRANTDILLGRNGGLHTLLVLSGITSLHEVKEWVESGEKVVQGWIPHYWSTSIADLLLMLD